MVNRITAILLLIILSPILIIISILIWFEDGSPILFRQKRIGKDYSFFNIYKFRSMKKETPNLATHLLHNSERYILKSGKLIRKLSLDELPNLINIVNGEMAFIGPRPALYNQEDLMKLRVEEGVHKLKPGITGWAQVNGRDNISINEKVNLEKYYLLNKSIELDFKIILFTFSSVLKSKGIKH